MSRDWDGDPTSKNYNKAGLKPKPKHSPKMGRKKGHTVHMGGRDGAYSDE